VDGLALVGDEVVEIDHSGTAVTVWSVFDYKKPVNYCVPCSKRFFYGGRGDDWTHANNLIYLPSENAYLLSIRHTDSIIKFDRSNGRILWELGGPDSDYLIPEKDRFSHQHAPELLENGDILLFDNGNHRLPEEFSRVAEYRLDHIRKTASIVWEYRLTGDEPFSSSYGDVDRLANGNTLIADFNNTLTEVTPDGRIAWQVELFQRRAKLHKALRVPDLYFPNDSGISD
jgi:hypothetical protein